MVADIFITHIKKEQNFQLCWLPIDWACWYPVILFKTYSVELNETVSKNKHLLVCLNDLRVEQSFPGCRYVRVTLITCALVVADILVTQIKKEQNFQLCRLLILFKTYSGELNETVSKNKLLLACLNDLWVEWGFPGCRYVRVTLITCALVVADILVTQIKKEQNFQLCRLPIDWTC